MYSLWKAITRNRVWLQTPDIHWSQYWQLQGLQVHNLLEKPFLPSLIGKLMILQIKKAFSKRRGAGTLPGARWSRARPQLCRGKAGMLSLRLSQQMSIFPIFLWKTIPRRGGRQSLDLVCLTLPISSEEPALPRQETPAHLHDMLSPLE